MIFGPLGACEDLVAGVPTVVVPRATVPLILSPLFALTTGLHLGWSWVGTLYGLTTPGLSRLFLATLLGWGLPYPCFVPLWLSCVVAQCSLVLLGHVCVGRGLGVPVSAVHNSLVVSTLGNLVVIWCNLDIWLVPAPSP